MNKALLETTNFNGIRTRMQQLLMDVSLLRGDKKVGWII